MLTQQPTGKLRNHQYNTHTHTYTYIHIYACMHACTYIHTYIHTYVRTHIRSQILSAGLEEHAENLGKVACVTVPISVTTYHAKPCPAMSSSCDNIQVLPLASACDKNPPLLNGNYDPRVICVWAKQTNAIRPGNPNISLQGQVMGDLDSCLPVWHSLTASPQPHKTIIRCRSVWLVCLPTKSRKWQNGKTISTRWLVMSTVLHNTPRTLADSHQCANSTRPPSFGGGADFS